MYSWSYVGMCKLGTKLAMYYCVENKLKTKSKNQLFWLIHLLATICNYKVLSSCKLLISYNYVAMYVHRTKQNQVL